MALLKKKISWWVKMVRQILFRTIAIGIETTKLALFRVVERFHLNSDYNKEKWESIANECNWR